MPDLAPQDGQPSIPLTFNLTLLPPDERVLVAVSGGADSMALLLCLVASGRDICVAHVNHGLRGEESDGDERFVVQHCMDHGLTVVTERVAVPPREGGANEEAARTARYECLARLAGAHGCARVATGHTASDLLETVLINWLRGAAVTGLSGIQAQRALAEGILVVRPLLGTTGVETRAACRQAGWPWREDASNQSPKFLRNRVRHELLPLLADLMQPASGLDQLARQTARAAEIVQADLDFLEAAAREAFAALIVRDIPNLVTLNGLGFRELPVALQRRVLRAAVRHLQHDVRDLGFELVETARRHIMANGRRAVWQWRRGLNVEWTGAMAGNRIRLWLVSDDGT